MNWLVSRDYGSISELATYAKCDSNEISRILPLAFLAPDITRAILAGLYPPELTAHSLKRIGTLPMAWPDQRQLLGFSPRNGCSKQAQLRSTLAKRLAAESAPQRQSASSGPFGRVFRVSRPDV